MDHLVIWFVAGMVIGPLLGYLLLAVWLWLRDVAGHHYREWKRKRGPQ